MESVKYYTVSGVEVSNPSGHKGMLIRVERLKNGKTLTRKEIVR